MDEQYLDAFIRESEEAITELNNSLLELESDPSDQAAMDSIFRTAHTLKGNFGAMGFDDASDLAHAIEDLLDAIRQGDMDVTPEIMDLVFAGVDDIEAIVTEIEANGEPSADTADRVEDIRAVMEDGPDAAGAASDDGRSSGSDGDVDAGAEGDTSASGASIDVEPILDRVDVPEPESGTVTIADVDIGGGDMQGVDAMLALDAIEDALDVVATDPSTDEIENGAFDETFAVFAAADEPTVRAAVDDVGPVESATVQDVSEAVAAADTADETGATDDAGTSASTSSGASETAVDEIKSVRVDVDQLDDLHGLVEQLVTSRIKLRRAAEQNNVDSTGETLNELDKITASLQNTVMDMRLIPLGKVVGKFPRLVRDLSRDLGKEIDFSIEGEDIELDRTILTEISDPLMHILRNAVDHGIEPPAERERKGKSREGSIELRARRERDHVVISVEDDGAGLDVEAIREQARKQGIRSADELDRMDDSAIYDLTFHPGFSTAEEVTGTSGRGVGMDVVHETVSQLDGSVNVESEPDEGTTVSLRLPVTMAIVKVLFIQVGDEQYGIPIKNVDEITDAGEAREINGNEVIKHNDEIYPIIHLDEAFDVPGERTNGDGMLIRVRESERKVALHCDEVNSQEEVVVKPLEGLLSGTPGLSGTAVIGDGNIVHILDVVTL